MIVKGIHFSTCTCEPAACLENGTILLPEIFISTTEALYPGVSTGSFFTQFYFLFNLAIRRVECITQGSPGTGTQVLASGGAAAAAAAYRQ